MVDPVFIVSTGRCGSTLLSRMLRQIPRTLSLSEIFIAMPLGTAEFPISDIDGRRFWDLLSSAEPFFDSVIREGLDLPELCYPYRTGRFNALSGIPRIAHMTLPMLTDDPDTLFDDLAAEVPTWPTRSSPDQVRSLFDHLSEKFDCRAVVERTGGSLILTPLLAEHFRGARFVHLHRNGPDCALSMSRHLGSRPLGLAEWGGLLPRQAAGCGAPGPVAAIVELLTPPMDAARIMAYPAPPVTTFGKLWSRMVTQGVTALQSLKSNAWIEVRYEELVNDPERELVRIADFAGIPPAKDWLAASRGLVHHRALGQAAHLAREVLASLVKACEPGTSAIAAASAQR